MIETTIIEVESLKAGIKKYNEIREREAFSSGNMKKLEIYTTYKTIKIEVVDEKI